MSLAVKATRSAAWMIAGGVVSKVVALTGTLLIVGFVAPGEYGEAVVASIVVGSASQLSSIGIGQFVIVKAGGRRDLAFHATVFQLLLGLVALALIAIFQRPIGAWSNAPTMARYLPGLAVAMLIDRISSVPERTLMRDMNFRRVALARSSGETGYTVIGVVTAVLGWGGMAVIAANVARSVARALVILPAVDRRDWLEPCRLRADATLALFRFGAPLSIGALSGYIASKWDNMMVSGFFGPAVMAAYNIAYNLASMASGIVTEHIVDILVPSFRRADADDRGRALARGSALVALVSMPVCVGLAAVSPTLVATVLREHWAGVAPMLSVLALAAALAPVLGLIIAFLQGTARVRETMIIQLVGTVTVLGAIFAVGRLGPLWTCGAVLFATALSVAIAMLIVRAHEPVPISALLATQLRPLLACLPMLGAVLGARALLGRAGIDVRFVNLVVEILAGGVAYVGGAFLFARPFVRDLLALLRKAFIK